VEILKPNFDSGLLSECDFIAYSDLGCCQRL